MLTISERTRATFVVWHLVVWRCWTCTQPCTEPTTSRRREVCLAVWISWHMPLSSPVHNAHWSVTISSVTQVYPSVKCTFWLYSFCGYSRIWFIQCCDMCLTEIQQQTAARVTCGRAWYPENSNSQEDLPLPL